MMNGFFITGTDTSCGKTEITLGLMQRMQEDKQTILGRKPIASLVRWVGSHVTGSQLCHFQFGFFNPV